MDPIINFRTALDKFGLGQNYLVLCLDTGCFEGAEAQNILAYDGYIMSAEEAENDYHLPVARAKVRVYNPIMSYCRWTPTLT